MKSRMENDYWVTSKILDEDRIDPYYYSTEFIKLETHTIKNRIKTKKVSDIYKVLDGEHGSVVYASNGIVFLRAQNIMDGYINSENLIYITKEQHEKSKRSKIYKDDLLLSIMASTGVSAVFNKNVPCNANRAVGILRSKKNESYIDSYYVVALINSKIGKIIFNRGIRGSIQKRLNITDINDLSIPIPSPEIQNYIGDKVRKAEELREEAKRLKKEAEDFLYKIIELNLLEEFDKENYSFVNSNYIFSERLDSEYYKTKYITLGKTLKSKKIVYFKDIIIDSKYGASVSADYVKSGIPFIRGNNLVENEINIDDIVCLSENIKDEIKGHIVNNGDILITRSGTVGISSVVDKNCDGFSFGSFMIKLCIDIRLWNPYYIAAYLNSYWGKWQIERLQNGAVQQNINMQEIGRIMVPIVKKEKQDKIEELIKVYINKKRESKQLIQEAKQDVEDLIEGNFDILKIKSK